jgi:hypothetical protein
MKEKKHGRRCQDRIPGSAWVNTVKMDIGALNLERSNNSEKGMDTTPPTSRPGFRNGVRSERHGKK